MQPRDSLTSKFCTRPDLTFLSAKLALYSLLLDKVFNVQSR